MSELQPRQNNTTVTWAVKQTLTLAVLTEPRSDTRTCLYGAPKHTATLRLIILKATLEDQRNVSMMERVRATLLWHALGLQMVPSGHARNDTRDGHGGASTVVRGHRWALVPMLGHWEVGLSTHNAPHAHLSTRGCASPMACKPADHDHANLCVE